MRPNRVGRVYDLKVLGDAVPRIVVGDDDPLFMLVVQKDWRDRPGTNRHRDEAKGQPSQAYDPGGTPTSTPHGQLPWIGVMQSCKYSSQI